MFETVKENRDLSPETGWTREHWMEIASVLLKGYLNTLDEKTGMPDIGNRLPENPYISSQELYGPREFFERVLILAAAWLKGVGITRKPDWPCDLAGSFRKAILLGTDPAGPGYWGKHAPMSAFGNGIATAALLAPEHFWAPFSHDAKRQIGYFLRDLALNESWDNNHWYFHMSPLPLLDELGLEYDGDYFDEKWDRIMGWYAGDGWYIDGNNQAFDYYNHWGFHYYNCFFYAFSPKWRTRYGAHIKEATTAFLGNYPRFFGADGASVPWGRSLIYRHALLAPLGWAEWAGINPLSPGLSRRIASGNLKFFFAGHREDGDDIITSDDLLAPGYLDTNPNLFETYSDKGSGYWSAVGMIPLALPENHPFWTAREETMPADRKEESLTMIEGPGMLLRQSQGRASLFTFKQPRKTDLWQLSIKYGQNGYDSSLGFAVAGEKGADPGFNRVGISLDGVDWQYRRSFEQVELNESWGASRYSLSCEGLEEEIGLIQYLMPLSAGEVQIFYHTGPESLFLSLGGWSLSCGETHEESSRNVSLLIRSENQYSLIHSRSDIPGDFSPVRVKGEFPDYPSHLLGGTGVFPLWKSRDKVEPGRALCFFTAAGEMIPGHDVIESALASGDELLRRIRRETAKGQTSFP